MDFDAFVRAKGGSLDKRRGGKVDHAEDQVDPDGRYVARAAAVEILAGQESRCQQEMLDGPKNLAVNVQEFVGDIVEKVVHRWIDVPDFLAALRAVSPAERSRARLGAAPAKLLRRVETAPP